MPKNDFDNHATALNTASSACFRHFWLLLACGVAVRTEGKPKPLNSAKTILIVMRQPPKNDFDSHATASSACFRHFSRLLACGLAVCNEGKPKPFKCPKTILIVMRRPQKTILIVTRRRQADVFAILSPLLACGKQFLMEGKPKQT